MLTYPISHRSITKARFTSRLGSFSLPLVGEQDPKQLSQAVTCARFTWTIHKSRSVRRTPILYMPYYHVRWVSEDLLPNHLKRWPRTSIWDRLYACTSTTIPNRRPQLRCCRLPNNRSAVRLSRALLASSPKHRLHKSCRAGKADHSTRAREEMVGLCKFEQLIRKDRLK